MMKTRMIFVRHGESEANLMGVFGGSANILLTEKGELQAEMAAKYLEKEKISVCYASDLARALKTGEIIAKVHGISPIKNEKFREINGGDWEMRKFDDLDKEFAKEYAIWKESH